jgi:hypothetical protein
LYDDTACNEMTAMTVLEITMHIIGQMAKVHKIKDIADKH